MSTYILTSTFPNGFNDEIAELFQQKIVNRKRFAFVASEFEKIHEKTDHYFRFFLNMFAEKVFNVYKISDGVVELVI